MQIREARISLFPAKGSVPSGHELPVTNYLVTNYPATENRSMLARAKYAIYAQLVKSSEPLVFGHAETIEEARKSRFGAFLAGFT